MEDRVEMNQSDREYFMHKALEMAQQGLDQGELPIGAVVVLNQQVIAAAHTRENAEGRLLVHADFLALEAADKLKPFPGRRRDAALFVNLEPCLMCFGAAMSCFIGAVYYGVESPGDGAVSLVRMWQKQDEDFPAYQVPITHGGILRDESIALFQQYVKHHSSGAMWEWAKTIANRRHTTG
jgi:tRNA(adenine34) deaminase